MIEIHDEMNKENLNKIEGTELNKIPMKFYDRNDGIVEMKEIVIYEHDFDNNAEIDSDDN
ncbi:8904_t:CDS:2, partial [Gigaspora rosea]